MQYSALLSSLAVAAVLSGCGMVGQDVSRSSAVDTLSFTQGADASLIQDQAVALNLMAHQLMRSSTVGSAQTGVLAVDSVSANALERSIRGMYGQIAAVQLGLPDLLTQQDADLRDLSQRRARGAVSRKKYEQSVMAILDSRATLAQTLALTVEQTEQARLNMTRAIQQGQSGLDWHLNAANQLAFETDTTRSTISTLMPVSFEHSNRVALRAIPRSGELR